MQIEDPFEQPDNTARAVGPHNLKTIAGVFLVTRQILSSSSGLSDRSSLLRLLSRPLVSSRLIAPKKTTYFSTYTPQQANKHQYTNMYGIQQGVLGSAESSLNRDRTTGIVDTYPNHSTHLSNGSNLSQKGNQSEKPVYNSSYRVPEDQIRDPNLNRNYGIRLSDPNHSTQLSNSSNLSQKGKQSEKPAYYSSYRVPEGQIHDPNLNRNYGIGLSDLNRLSQQANGSNPSQSNHRYHEVTYSAQYLDRPGQDYVSNLNESHGTRSTIAVPNHDNLARNHRNNGIRFAGQTPERFDRRYDSSSSGMHSTGMASVEQSKDPSLIKNRQSQSHQRVGYSTTPPGSFDLNYDAGMNGMNGMHRSGLAIVEPVTEQLNHSLKLNGQHSGSRSKGKQIWQTRGASNQGFL